MKLHPLARLVINEPHLIVSHLKAYVGLVRQEAGKVSTTLLTRVAFFAAAGALAVLGILFVGVALLLRSSVPSDAYPAGWALVVVPLVPLVIAAVLVVIARGKPVDLGLKTVKEQLDADAAMLREATAPAPAP